VIWENSGSASTFLMQPHTSPAFANVAPQGYMAATEDKLLISGGRSTPAAYDRRTGDFLYYRMNDFNKTGRCEVMASGDCFFNSNVIHGLSDGFEITKAPASVTAGDVFFSSRNNTVAAYRLDREKKKAVESWKTELPSEIDKIHIKAGSRLYCTAKDDKGKILAVDMPQNGKAGGISWQGRVEGEVWSMLAADGKLFAVTVEGKIYCFAEKSTEPKIYERPAKALPQVSAAVKDEVRHILDTTGQREGYALLLGLGDGELCELLNQSQLHVIALDPDGDKVEAVRRQLDDAGLYGNRAAVHVGSIMTMQLPPYMANLVVATDPRAAGFRRDSDFVERVYKVLRPYGGTACFQLDREKHNEAFKKITDSELVNCTVISSDQLLCVKRSGPLPGSADWTHQYADPANTVMSKDQLKAPLGLLWFGGPPNDKVLPRHGHGPAPQVVDGRLFIEGRNMLRAVDVYTGRLLWERQFDDLGKFYDNTSHQPGANEIGSNYVTMHDAVYVVYGQTIHVLDPATGITTKEFSLGGEEKPNWGTILVCEDLLLATASPIQVRVPVKTKNKEAAAKTDNLPVMTLNADYASSSKILVAMNRHTGKILWTRDAEYSFRHNTIVIGAGKIFCIDGMSDAKLAFLKRRGISFEKEPTLYALDARTGQIQWKTNRNIFGTWLAYSGEHDILLQAGSRSGDRATDEVDKGMAAYRGSDGEELWRNNDSYKGPPILYHDWVITQTGGGSASAAAEAKAYNLQDGTTVMHQHPMTGETIPWTWVRFKGCNTAIASENLLTFRSASGAFVDLAAKAGTASIGGFKSGCTSNLIIADGVLNAPDYTRTCVCSYQNQASLALVHMPEVAYWTFDYYRNPSEATPVRQVGINFGAPGNRTSEDGTLWLEFPSVGGPSPDVPVRATYDNPKWFRRHNSQVKDEHNWITASGATGLKEVRIRMFIQPGKNPSAVDAFDKHIGKIPTWPEEQIVGTFEQPRPYTVRLYFAETDDLGAGRRTFDVSLQGKTVLKDFDIAKEAGGTNRTIIKEFTAVAIKDDLRIAFAGKSENHGPLLCGVEIIAEDSPIVSRETESP